MISKRLNLGCGPDIKAGWTNIDSEYISTEGEVDFRVYDVTADDFATYFTEKFDFVLVNHVICTMNDYSAHKALINLHRALNPGGKLHIIDMDILKVFQSYQDGRVEDIPIEHGDLDDRLCHAISGYGTRLSLYTPQRMETVLYEAGFRFVHQIDESKFDTRPKESLIFEATK